MRVPNQEIEDENDPHEVVTLLDYLQELSLFSGRAWPERQRALS